MDSTRATGAQFPTGMSGRQINLEQIRLLGRAALDCSAIPNLLRAVLREVRIAFDNLAHENLILLAEDIFMAAAEDGPDLFPMACSVTRAVIDFYFSDSPQPHSVVMEPPFTIELNGPSDTVPILNWAAAQGLLVEKQTPPPPPYE